MATYRALKGFEIQVQSSDPTNPVKGQVWYNTTTGTLKVSGVGTWSSQASTTRTGIGSQGAGTTTAAVFTAGKTSGPGSPPIATQAYTEEYDGSVWTNGNDQLVGRRHCGSGGGTQTAAIVCGGNAPPGDALSNNTGLYDGTSWTTGSTMPIYMGNQFNAQSGTQTAFYTTGSGSTPGSPPHVPQTTLELNGTTWSSTNPLSRSPVTYNGGGAGTQTAGLAFGGSATAYSESYDGTSWAATSALTTPTGSCSGSGTQTAAIMAGGYTSGYPTVCNAFDGSAWSTIDTMPSGRERAAACGQAGNMLLAGGSKDVTDVVDFTCVEYSDPVTTTITTST